MKTLRPIHRALGALLLFAVVASGCVPPTLPNSPFAHDARDRAVRACIKATGATWGQCAWTLYQAERAVADSARQP